MHENEESVIARNQLTRFALRSTHLKLSWGVIVGAMCRVDSRSRLGIRSESFRARRRKSWLRVGHFLCRSSEYVRRSLLVMAQKEQIYQNREFC